MAELLSILIPVIPLAAVWAAVRYGPVRSRWHRREHPLGFALFVGGVAFLAGFVGPMVFAPSANQGPLLGVLITGPAGTLLGFVWGLMRASRR